MLRQLKLSLALQAALRKGALSADVVHSHGLWVAPNIYAGQAAAAARISLVVSPRGMLSPGALRFSTIKKQLMWKTWQGPAYRNAAAWHATSASEADEIRAFGITGPIAIIPNGIDLPEQVVAHSPGKVQRTVVFLSRLHPKKGIPSLVEAWARLAPRRPDWRLVIAGPDEGGHRSELEGMVRSKNVPRVVFPGPLYGPAKDALLDEADLFVLPTQSENFGIAVAEALAAGIPAIVTTGAPWQGLATQRCGWWIEQGVEPLQAALQEATALSASERRMMGLRGREWMRRDFAWNAIGRDMRDLYLWLAGEGRCPSTVELA